jgi:pimeloyl-ACP methyl ester carboxylesterase
MKPTLLFTHGWSLDQSDWNGVRDAFSDRYHLVFWDLGGLGRSTAPRNADHSLEKMAADLEAVLTQATSGPVVLIGHSIGGMIQQTFCRLFPQHLEQRVRGIVFVHTTYTNPAKTAFLSPLLTALQKPVLEPLTYLTIWLAPLMWMSNWQSYWNGSLHLSTRLTSFAGRQTWRHIDHASRLQARAWPAVVGRGMLAMTRFDEQATLPQIHVPALVIAGQDDRLTKPEASHVLAQRLADAKLITLRPAGHFGLWEQQPEFQTALATFVDAVMPKSESVREPIAASNGEMRGR